MGTIEGRAVIGVKMVTVTMGFRIVKQRYDAIIQWEGHQQFKGIRLHERLMRCTRVLSTSVNGLKSPWLRVLLEPTRAESTARWVQRVIEAHATRAVKNLEKRGLR